MLYVGADDHVGGRQWKECEGIDAAQVSAAKRYVG